MATPTAGFTGANLSWSKVDVLTAYQRLTGEIQVRGGRLRETMNDPEPLFHMRNVSAEPLLPGAVPLNGVPEGLFNKAMVGGISDGSSPSRRRPTRSRIWCGAT